MRFYLIYLIDITSPSLIEYVRKKYERKDLFLFVSSGKKPMKDYIYLGGVPFMTFTDLDINRSRCTVDTTVP